MSSDFILLTNEKKKKTYTQISKYIMPQYNIQIKTQKKKQT